MRSFSRRITLWIAITQLVVMGLASYGIYVIAKSFIIMEEAFLYQSYVTTTNVGVGSILYEVSAGAVNHVSEIESSLANPDKIGSIMQRVIAQNPHIHSCGLSFVADYYPQKGHWFCPYAYRDTTGQVRLQTLGSVRRDYLKEDWFVEALERDSCYWSKPFFEHNDSLNPQVSYLVPIHDAKGTTVGILGVDISLDWFSKKLVGKMDLLGDSSYVEIYVDEHGKTRNANVKVEQPEEDEDDDFSIGYQLGLNRGWRLVNTSFIIDSEGTFIAHPDPKVVLRQNYFELAKLTNDTLDDYLGHKMVEGYRGTYEDAEGVMQPIRLFNEDAMKAYVFCEPVANTNWSVVMVVPWAMIDGIGIAVGIIMIVMIGLALLVVRFAGLFIIRRFTRPLKQLAESAGEVAKGNFNAPLPAIKHNDEIRLLRDSFEDMQHSLTTYMEELRDTTAEKASIENELKIAHDIQMSMLPKTFPPYPERNDIDIFGSLTPAKDVGGDLFDFYIRDEHLYFCIGDVSGKGVPASLVMAVTRTLFRNVSAHVSEPERIVSAINAAISESNETSMFVTVFLGVLNLADGHLVYCNAGHNPPLVINSEGCHELPCASNLAVGLLSDFAFECQEVLLEPETVVFLYTDGLNEAEDRTHAQFTLERVMSEAESLVALGDTRAETIVRQMTEAVGNFVGGAEQSDDLTMLAIRYK